MSLNKKNIAWARLGLDLSGNQPNPNPFNCEWCGKRFASLHGKKIHHKTIHRDKPMSRTKNEMQKFHHLQEVHHQ